MSYSQPTVPNVTDYTTFLRNELSIPLTALPDNSVWIGYALNASLNQTLQVYTVAAQDYVNIVYCGAAHIQLFITPDQSGQTYFADARSGYHMLSFTTGLVSNASDQGTSSTTVVPESMKRLTFQDLQFMTTPWGRLWMGWGQDYGSPWGIS